MKKFLDVLFLIFLLAMPSFVWAENHFVRADANGNSDGSDWANAFSGLPSTLIRGDTYYIADGEYGSYRFDDPANGDQVITIRKATNEDYGGGRHWDTVYGDGVAHFSSPGTVWMITTDDWIFDGAVGGGPGSWQSGHGIHVECTTGNNNTRVISIYGSLDNVTFRRLELESEIQGTDATRTDII